MLVVPVEKKKTKVALLADDENALQYASGYIGMKLMKQCRKVASSPGSN